MPSGPSKRKAQKRSSAQLVFVNYTNPEEEEKDKEKKALVARWSVVNTQPRNATRFNPPPVGSAPGAARTSVLDPTELVSAATTDPFASLPWALGRREWKLLHFWMDSSSFDRVPEDVRLQLSQIRRTISLPERLKSKAGLAANLALVETMLPTPPDQLKLAVAPHLSKAFEALGQTIAQGTSIGVPACVLHCISVVMTVSLRTGDLQALRTHVYGLASLISRHPDLIWRPNKCVSMAVCWTFAYTATPQLPRRPTLLEFDISTCSIPPIYPTGIGFEQLRRNKLVSEHLSQWIVPLLVLRPLSATLRAGTASVLQATDFLRCAWASMLTLRGSKGQSTTPLERSIRCCLVIYLAQELVAEPETVLRNWAAQFFRHFARVDLRRLVPGARALLLWMMLLSGPYAQGAVKIWCLRVLMELQKQRELRGFPAARKVCMQFLWSEGMDERAEAFYADAGDSVLDALELPRFMPVNNATATGDKEHSDGDKEAGKRRMPMHCAFCGRPHCTSIMGGIWAASGADCYRMCDIEWFDEEDGDDAPVWLSDSSTTSESGTTTSIINRTP